MDTDDKDDDFEELHRRSLRVIEWPLVQARLLACCQWAGGREVLESLQPLSDMEELELRQARIREALEIECQGLGRSLGGLDDPREALEAALRGRVLDPEQLLTVERLCAISREVWEKFKGTQKVWPLTSELLLGVHSFSRLEQRLRRSLSRDGRVSDEASMALRRIRDELRQAEERLTRSLNALLRHPELSKTFQEPIITQRNGRFVIPVKSEYRGRFPGLVIDQSSSGATVFMEPYLAVSLGNELRQKQMAEEREIHRILVELSAKVGEDGLRLERAARSLALLDGYLAVARYALAQRAFLPKVGEDLPLVLRKAHHPLIDEGSVPIDLELSGEHRTLVVTGPNTGGKTVALKIVGLLTLMGSCGFPIPASEESTLPLLPKILADIGDEQSLSQSLSTFSAHLVHILAILEQADHRSLILLDELGAGTDPSEGGALGMTLLNALHAKGARTLASTHLSALKTHAKATPGFQNAAVEFDTQTLRPTYRILMGIPGRSNALAIASQLGLPDELVREARSYLGGGQREMEELLDDLELERDAARRSEERLESERSSLAEERARFEELARKLEERKADEIEKARTEASELLAQTQEKTRALLREFQQELKVVAEERKEALLQARRLARSWAERVRGHDSERSNLDRYASTPVSEAEIAFDSLGHRARAVSRTLEAELDELRENLPRPAPVPGKNSSRGSASPEGPAAPGVVQGPRELAPGTRIFAPKLGQEGEVVEQKGQRVDVRLGILKMSLERDEVEVLANQDRPAPSKRERGERRPEADVASFENRLNVRGQTVDLALLEVDRFLDRAFLAQVGSVTILHGKGSGTLRKAIQAHLKQNRLVAGIRDGAPGEGGWGVTVVKMVQ